MFTIEMVFVKETKNTYVYKEEESTNESKIPSLYIRKSAMSYFGDTTPNKINVTVGNV